MTWTEQDVTELLALWQEHSPDPVDRYEDNLAAAAGLIRHPDLSLGAWRRIRVRAIDQASGQD